MYKEKIEEYFQGKRADMIKDICDLVAIKSDKGLPRAGMPFGEGPAKALAHTINLAARMGFNVKNHEGYVGTIDFNDKETELGILAHLDVVPEGIGWTMNPYKPVVKDGKIYGRGTSDDKGPAIVALYAMKAVKDLGIELDKNVRLILGTDEECGASDIEYYFAKEQAPPKVFSPDGNFPVINIEKGRIQGNISSGFMNSVASGNSPKQVIEIQGGVKSNVIPQLAHAIVENLPKEKIEALAEQVKQSTGVNFELSESAGKVRIDAEGTSGHASTPFNGNNAITALLELLSKLDLDETPRQKVICDLTKLFPHNDYYAKAIGIARENEESGDTTISLNMIDFTLNNISAVFDTRTAIGSTKENSLEVMRANLKEVGLDLEADFIDVHYVDKDSDFIKTLLSKYEKYSGREGYCSSTGGGTYVHNIEGGVSFGCCLPETDTHMHGADEFVKIYELMISAKIFTECIIATCGANSSEENE